MLILLFWLLFSILSLLIDFHCENKITLTGLFISILLGPVYFFGTLFVNGSEIIIIRKKK